MGAHALAADERRLCQTADAVVAVSEFASDDLASAYGIPKPVAIPNGVDRARFTPVGNARPSSGFHVDLDPAGSVTERRALGDVLDRDPRWTSLFERDTDDPVRLVWVGKFTQMKGFDRLQRIAAQLGRRGRLLIVLGHGQVHYPVNLPDEVLVCQDLDPADMPAVYRAADYLLSTSRWEGYGLAIAEALACGTPALLPAGLAVADELIIPGVTGHLWSNEEELLSILGQHPSLAGRLPDRYTWPANAAATIVAYQALTSPAAQASR